MLRLSLPISSVMFLVLVTCSQAERFQPLVLSDVAYDLGRGERRIAGFDTAYLNAAGQAVVEVDYVWNPIAVDSIDPDSIATLPELDPLIDLFARSATVLALGDHGPKVVATTVPGLTLDERPIFHIQYGPVVGFSSGGTFLAAGLNVDADGKAVFVGLSDHLGTPLSGKPLWRGDGDSLNTIVSETLPGVESFLRSEVSGPLVAAEGVLAFGGLSIGQGSALDIRSSVWRRSAGGISLLAQEGSPAAGMAEGVYYSSIGLAGLNGAGDALLRGWAWRGVRGEITDGIWLVPASGEAKLVASEGQQAPGAAAGVEFAFNMFPAIGGATVAFSATTVDSNGGYGGGIWIDRGHGLEKVAASGDRVPIDESERVFTIFGGGYEPAVNSRGDVAFEAWSHDSGVGIVGSTPGLWIDYAGTGFTSIVQQGDQAPGLEAGTEFDRTSEPALLSNGDTLFTASLRGASITDENQFSLWRFEEEGVLTLILRTGDVLDLALGDQRQVASFALAGLGSGTDDGLPRSFNDAGQIALSIDFMDGTSGVVLYDPTAVPEPTGLIASALCCTLLIARKRNQVR